jgi:cytidine deaminase
MEKYELSKKQIHELIDLAFDARRNAYVPYSNYYVGAALLTKSGKIFKGCNVESCSYTPTTCAERVAVLKAVSEGEREFIAIAVVGGMGLDDAPKEQGAPCGVCRQLIYEFGSDTLIIGAKSKEDYYVMPISDLLPKGFGPQNLT